MWPGFFFASVFGFSVPSNNCPHACCKPFNVRSSRTNCRSLWTLFLSALPHSERRCSGKQLSWFFHCSTKPDYDDDFWHFKWSTF